MIFCINLWHTISEYIVVSANDTAKLLVDKELTKVGSF